MEGNRTRRHKFYSALAGLLCISLTMTAAAATGGTPCVEGDLYETAQDVSVYGNVRVFDPDGGSTTIQVLSTPTRGAVRFDGSSFCYTPFPGERGEDSFTVAATDEDGNVSQPAVIAVRISSAQGLPFFCDMDRHPYEYSAIQLAKAGIVGGEQVGGRLFYYPTRQVTRGEFIIELLAARGWDTGLSVCVNTGLENDADIPAWMKPYIRRAIEKGLVTETAFNVSTVPTRAEAVVLTCRAAQIDDILKYNLMLTDLYDIPDWAMESYINLAAYRMLDLYDSRARPNNALDRGWAASLLWQLYKYRQS